MKALCNKVRSHCRVNKIFEALQRLLKCQMRTQNPCLAIHDPKKTVTKVNKAIPTVIPLVQASLTSYTLQPFLVQVDMGTTMYDVSSYNPQTVEPITPNWLNHDVHDGPLFHTLDGFVPPAEVQDRRMQTAAVHVQPLCHRECCRSHIRNHCGNLLLCPGHRLLCPWHCRCKCSHSFWGDTFYLKCH